MLDSGLREVNKQMAKLVIGNPAPDFMANSTKGPIRLSDYQGKKNLVLCFYVMDDTPV
jgi:peroxiredoxin Q/BCP